jgi:multiple sugar transport system permease protein
MWYGNTMIILIAGILGINTSLFEAAEVDGASGRQIFARVTLPMLKPILLYTLITSLIGGMQMFDIPQLMQRQGTPAKPMLQTTTGYIYQLAFEGTKDFGRSATVSVFLFLFTAVFSLILFYIMRDKDAIELKKLERKRIKAERKGNLI